MTTILAIETSTELASVSLLLNESIISRDLAGVQTHSFGLLPAVQEILQEVNIGLDQLDAIAFGCGPGAFTGVRTACGVVQGLAFGLQLPVISVVSLLSMAEAAKESNGCCDVLCCLDARMNEVYWAHYRFDGTAWIEIEAPRLSEFDMAVSYATEMKANLVLGQGLQLPENLMNLPHVYSMPHAQFALRIARMKLRQGLQVDASYAQPLYLRNKVALTTAERLLAREI